MMGKMKLGCDLRSIESAGALERLLINDESKLIDMLVLLVWNDFPSEEDLLFSFFWSFVAASFVARDDVWLAGLIS
jgi:hypothetical protein